MDMANLIAGVRFILCLFRPPKFLKIQFRIFFYFYSNNNDPVEFIFRSNKYLIFLKIID